MTSLRAHIRPLTPRYRRLQREARELYGSWSAIGTEDALVHPMWQDAATEFRELVTNGVPADFLSHPVVRHMLYRTGFGELEEMESAYLASTEPWIRELCARYREPSAGQPVRDWRGAGRSVSALNKLYYFARIAEVVPESELRTIMEFGGGYGLMCHILEELIEPRPTYVLVDLPELLALQYVFLRDSSAIPLTPHMEEPIRLRPQTVNLVPVQLLATTHIRCDLFVSTFALSETPTSVQSFVAAEREFFGASSLYLTGQNTEADLWRQYSLEQMEPVKRAVELLYESVRVESLPAISAWELVATGPRA